VHFAVIGAKAAEFRDPELYEKFAVRWLKERAPAGGFSTRGRDLSTLLKAAAKLRLQEGGVGRANGTLRPLLETIEAMRREPLEFTTRDMTVCLQALSALELRETGNRVMRLLLADSARASATDSFGNMDVCYGLRGAAKADGAVERGVVEPLMAAAARLSPRFVPMDVSSCLWAAATMELRDAWAGAHVSALSAAAARLAPRFEKPQDAAQCLWAVAKLQPGGGGGGIAVVAPLVTAAARLSGHADFLPQHAANCLWGMATLELDGPAHAEAARTFAAAAARLLDESSRGGAAAGREFTAQGAANCLWAAAKLRLDRHSAEVGKLLAAAARLQEGFIPQNASNCLLAVAELGFSADGPAVLALLGAAARLAPHLTAYADGQTVTNMLDAVSKLGLSREHATVRALAAAAVRVAPTFDTPQHATNGLHAAAKLGLGDSAAVSALLDAAVRLAGEFSPQQASNALWAVAVLREADARAVDRRRAGALAAAAGAKAPTFVEAQHAVNCLWAVAKLELAPDAPCVAPLVATAARLAPTFNAQDAANSLWAAASLGRAQPAEQVRVLAGAAVRLAPIFSPQQAANALWAAATLGLGGEGAALADAAARLAPEFSAQAAANALWAAASLGLAAADTPRSRALVAAAQRAAGAFTADQADSVLQAHFAGARLGEAALAACWRAFRSKPPRPVAPSQLQLGVEEALRGMGLSVKSEVEILDGLRRVDIVVGGRVAVEVDGPSHFFEGGGAPIPRPSLLRDLHAKEAGYAQRVVVPFYKWNEAVGAEAKRELLHRLLGDAAAAAAAAAATAQDAGPAGSSGVVCGAGASM
jgi:hypothetical protein